MTKRILNGSADWHFFKRLDPMGLAGYPKDMISPEGSSPESLKYAMLGEDTSSVEEKLEKYTGTVGWSYLAPHFKSGVLYFVDPSLGLADVGRAFTANEKEAVDAWLKAGDLVKIGDLHAEQWRKGDTEFEALVVSPFVLCRPV
jgi:hypothetical protein